MFEEYTVLNALSTIQAYSTKYKRTDIVFDVYWLTRGEADTWIFVHARYATETGSKVIMVKASDTDVIIAVSVLQELQELGFQQLWVTYG